MTTPKPDPAAEAATHIVDLDSDLHWETEWYRERLIRELTGVVRDAYAEYMRAAAEMAKVLKVRMPLDPEAFAALARWRELSPEIEG